MKDYKIYTTKILRWIEKMEENGFFRFPGDEYIVLTNCVFIKTAPTCLNVGYCLCINPHLKSVTMWDVVKYEDYKNIWPYLKEMPNRDLVKTNLFCRNNGVKRLGDRLLEFSDFKEWFEEGGDE